MDENEEREQERHDRRMADVRDAARYRKLRAAMLFAAKVAEPTDWEMELSICESAASFDGIVDAVNDQGDRKMEVKRPIDMLFDGVAWTEVPGQGAEDGTPWVTHEGVVEILGLPPMRCYRLSSGQAVFDGDDFGAWIKESGLDSLPEAAALMEQHRVTFTR